MSALAQTEPLDILRRHQTPDYKSAMVAQTGRHMRGRQFARGHLGRGHLGRIYDSGIHYELFRIAGALHCPV